MIARYSQTAAAAVLAVSLLGLGMPQAAQARDYDRGSYSYSGHHDRDDDDGPSRHRSWRHHPGYYRYAPRYYYPEVVVYPVRPRAYYYAPYYPATVYPSDYGTIGIHLDYNLRY